MARHLNVNEPPTRLTIKRQTKGCRRVRAQGWVTNWVTITTNTRGLLRIQADLFTQVSPDRPWL